MLRPIQTQEGQWYAADVADSLPETGYFTITLLHYRKDETFRMKRLLRVVQHILHHTPDAVGSILALHDYKGLLSVNWRTCPSTSALTAVVNAWGAESEYDTNHFVRSQPLLGDVEMVEWPAGCSDAHQTIAINRLPPSWHEKERIQC
jgi:hypothetical protein